MVSQAFARGAFYAFTGGNTPAVDNLLRVPFGQRSTSLKTILTVLPQLKRLLVVLLEYS